MNMKRLPVLLLIMLTVLSLATAKDDQIPSNPDEQQALWLGTAYAFLNGDYYSTSYPYMAYGMPHGLYYSPYYMPYYTQPYYSSPYYSSYSYPSQRTPISLGYTPGFTPSQGYGVSSPGYGVMTAYDPNLGTYLTDGSGRALYHLVNDGGNYNSICKDTACTGIWPPFYAQITSVAANLNPQDFRTITVNGYKQYQQTAYKGWPLYYYYGDAAPGQIKGQGIKDSYGTWSVVIPSSASTFPANFPYSMGTATPAQYQNPTPQNTAPAPTSLPYSSSGY